jgi:hypothetical protein
MAIHVSYEDAVLAAVERNTAATEALLAGFQAEAEAETRWGNEVLSILHRMLAAFEAVAEGARVADREAAGRTPSGAARPTRTAAPVAGGSTLQKEHRPGAANTEPAQAVGASTAIGR